jgi:alpha-1,3-rhamnosyltransferase
LIPSYNHEAFLEESVRSVWDQGNPDVELIVIDDCSTDRSWELLQELAARSPIPMIVRRNESNRGASATLKRALSLAHGEYVAFQASDDRLCKGGLDGSVSLLQADPELQAVYANGRAVRDGIVGERVHGARAIELLRMEPERVLRRLYTEASPLFIQAAVYRRSRLQAIPCFEEQGLVDDWLLNVRFFESVASAREYAHLDADVFLYRQHDANVHRDFERQHRLRMEFVERHTPEWLKAEALSNVYFWVAKRRLERGKLRAALEEYRRSQSTHFRWRRLPFPLRCLAAWLADKSGRRAEA